MTEAMATSEQDYYDKQAREGYAEGLVVGLRELVNEQAEDEGLWFVAQTAAEAYLQQELRRLHVAIEGGE